MKRGMNALTGALPGAVLGLMFLLAAPPGLCAQDQYSWEECVKTAEANHPALKQAAASIEKAKEDRGVSRSAYLPQISLSAGAQRSRYDASSSGVSTVGGTRTSYSYGISGSQLVFDGMKTLYEMKAAGSRVDEAKLQYLVESSTIRYNLRLAYIAALRGQREQGILLEIVSLMKKNMNLVKTRYDAGLEHLGSLLTSKANYSSALFEYEQSRNNYDFYLKQLSYRMGLKNARPLRVTGDLAVATDTAAAPDMEGVAERNPKLLGAIQQKQSAEYALRSSESGFYPSISINGSLGKSDAVFPPERDQWSVGISATYPLFSGGATWYQRRKNLEEVSRLGYGVESASQTLLLSLEQAWNDLRNKHGLVKVRQEYLKAAEERAKIADANYSIGFIVFDNWIIIQNEYVNSRKALVQAQADAMAAEAAWFYSKGVSLNDEIH